MSISKSNGRVATALGLLATTLFLSACAPDSGNGSPSVADSVKIGVVLPLSGAQASLGTNQRAGLEFVIDSINSNGGIDSLNGAEIELVFADDTSDARVAIDETRRLITREGVQMIVGLSSSSQVISTGPILEQEGVAGLSLTAQSPGEGDHTFTIGVTAQGMAEAKVGFLDFLRDSGVPDVTRVAIAYADYEAGHSVRDAERALLEEGGYEIVGEVALSTDATDLTPAIIQLKSMDPDVILSTALNAAGIRLHEARASQDYHDPIWIGNFGGWVEEAVWDAIGEDVARRTLANRAFVMDYYDSSVEVGPAAKLVEEAQAAGVESSFGGHFIMGAQGARVLEAALEEAGASGEITPAALYEAMFNISLSAEDGTVYLPRERLNFTEERVFEDQTGVILQWTEDGGQEPLYPEKFAKAEPRL